MRRQRKSRLGRRLGALALALVLVGAAIGQNGLVASAAETVAASADESQADGESQAEQSTSESQAELDTPESQAEQSTSESQAEQSTSESQAEQDTPESQAETDPAAEGEQNLEQVSGSLEPETVTLAESALPDSDELFAGYVQQQLYAGFNGGVSLLGNFGESALTGLNRQIYSILKTQIAQVASGEISSTVFEIPLSELASKLPPEFTWTAQDLGVTSESEIVEAVNNELAALGYDLGSLMDCLVADCPYELYWFDKTEGMQAGGYGYSYSQNSATGEIISITLTGSFTFSLVVAESYRSDSASAYETDTGKTGTAAAVVETAENVVADNQGKSTYEKLAAYKKTICDLVSYNSEAAGNASTPYGDPWQLIYVFDGDTSTNVVCEGYAKAFQYLCDLSGIPCYTVTGTMEGGTGAGPHMWNLVPLNGANYLVDVTNCDTGTVGAPDGLFLAGLPGSWNTGYIYTASSQTVTYSYDGDTQSMYGANILTLAETSYTETLEPLTGSVTLSGTARYGETLTAEVAGTPAGASLTYSFYRDGETEALQTGSNSAYTLTVGDVGHTISVQVTGAGYTGSLHDQTETVAKRAVTIQIGPDTKTYGDPDTPTILAVGTLASGDEITGEPDREEGETVGIYGYSQGTLSVTNSQGYDITYDPRNLTIDPAEYSEQVTAEQTVIQGAGDFIQPEFVGIETSTGREEVPGTLIYSYGGITGGTYEQVREVLAELPAGTTGRIQYSFQPDVNGNYHVKETTGAISFRVQDVAFQVNGETATESSAVTVKANPVYGDSWEEILTIQGITASLAGETDAEPSHFRLDVSGMPEAGAQAFQVLYSGTLSGKIYTDQVVCSGTVNVAPRTVTVEAGSYQVSKVYDGTVSAGTAEGSLSVDGVLAADSGVTVNAEPEPYASPHVGGQSTVQVKLTLTGTGSENYQLAADEVRVPCSITPKTVVPSITIQGTYTYTGEPIVPSFQVSYREAGSLEDTMLEAEQYTAVYADNIQAGTGTITLTPVSGGNYTWAEPVTAGFTIGKAVYTGRTEGQTSGRYGNEAVYELAAFLPAGSRLGTLEVTDPDQILDGSPVVEGTQLSYALTDLPENVGKTATIIIPVTETENYLSFELVITVTVDAKLTQTLAFASQTLQKTYGDAGFVQSVTGAAAESTVTYASSDPTVATVDGTGAVRILQAGSTVITASASATEDYRAGEASYTLEVSPLTLAWDISELTARDKVTDITGGQATLSGSLQVTGILAGDRADVAFACPAEQLQGVYRTVAVGNQPVTLSWAGDPVTLQGTKAVNYRLPDTLPEIQGVIHQVSVLPVPPESDGKLEYRLEREHGISYVPEALQIQENLSTPAAIETVMRLVIQQMGEEYQQENTEVSDITLWVSVDGAGWVPATEENFPDEGITVTLPYPEGTSPETHDYVVAHMLTVAQDGLKAGEVEYLAVTETAEGIQFKLYSLSPVSVGWTEQVPETTPEETLPEETLPEETLPEETTPEETTPEETTPEETTPEETTPEETTPETTTPETTPAATTTAPASETAAGTGTVQTGDTSLQTLYGVLMAAAVAMILVLALQKKRR